MPIRLLIALLLLAACAPKLEVATEPMVVMEEVSEAAPASLDDQRCTPGDDDGIGGTGCQVD